VVLNWEIWRFIIWSWTPSLQSRIDTGHSKAYQDIVKTIKQCFIPTACLPKAVLTFAPYGAPYGAPYVLWGILTNYPYPFFNLTWNTSIDKVGHPRYCHTAVTSLTHMAVQQIQDMMVTLPSISLYHIDYFPLTPSMVLSSPSIALQRSCIFQWVSGVGTNALLCSDYCMLIGLAEYIHITATGFPPRMPPLPPSIHPPLPVPLLDPYPSLRACALASRPTLLFL